MKSEVAVLDLGTSKVCCAIAKGYSPHSKIDSEAIESKRTIRILGTGYHLASGIKRNSITALEKLEESILSAISVAEKDAEKPVKSILIALPSWATKSHIIKSSIQLGQLPVDDIHIGSLLNFKTSEYIDCVNNEIIHVFPISYSLDDIEEIQNPIGMVGETLSSTLHVITASKIFLRNIKNCLNRNNIEVEKFISSAYASGLSVLIQEEMDLGVTLIDFGGSTISISFFGDNSFLYTTSIPIGGDNITNDISIILRTTKSHAERLKILYGISGVQGVVDDNTSSSSLNDEQCLVPKIDEYGEEYMQSISKNMLDSIIRARLEEILEAVEKRIANTVMARRIVITGGGSRLSGISEFIKTNKFFKNFSLRLGKPIGAIGSHDFVQTSSFATTAGAVLHCLSPYNQNSFDKNKSITQKIITWLKRGI
ncbi:MAG: cell division protein FtsA [Holosporales bacterium]|jgi:cell division protein FtsA|nr:cell division protein FtsA [Holosporales bacterium]